MSDLLEEAAAAERSARLRRANHRRRSIPGRADQLQAAVDRLSDVLVELRREIGRLPWHPAVEERYGEALRDRSLACQAERRSLRKMLRRSVG